MKKNLIFINYKGALTSKPYSFKSRPWELKHIETIDLFDSLGSNIKISFRGSELLRITPSVNEHVNEEWITDKARFAFDGFKKWRFINPLVKIENNFIKMSWHKTFDFLQYKLIFNNIKAIKFNVGPYVDLETLLILKKFSSYSSNITVQHENQSKNISNDLTNNLNLIKQMHNFCLVIVDSNVRIESPIINLYIRKESFKNNILIAYIGSSYNMTINMHHLGINLKILFSLIKGKHWYNTYIVNFLNFVNKKRVTNLNNVFILLSDKIFENLNLTEFKINKFYFKFIRLSNNISLNGFNFLNIKKKTILSKNFLIYNLSTLVSKKTTLKDIIIYQGHHGDKKILTNSDFIFPSLLFYEITGSYLNNFNIYQKAIGIQTPFKEVRENWKIISIFFSTCFSIYDKNIVSLKNIQHIFLTSYNLNFNFIQKKKFLLKLNSIKLKYFSKVLVHNITNYYLSNFLFSYSVNMQNCSKHFYKNKNTYLWY